MRLKTLLKAGLTSHAGGERHDRRADRMESIRFGRRAGAPPRQREVLQLVAEGRTMKEIADILGISVRTAESHKYETMGALGGPDNSKADPLGDSIRNK